MTQVASTSSHPSARTAAAASGRVLMWRGGSVWMGRATSLVQPHAHHAMQITLAPKQPVRFRCSLAADWRDMHASIVMPDRQHQFDGCGQDVVMIFVEPETLSGRALSIRYGDADLTPIDDATVLRRACDLLAAFDDRAAYDDAALIEAAKQVVDLLTGQASGTAVPDQRITRVLDWIRDHLDAPIALGQAAAIAHLSPSRFRHLFVAQTGISFRAYLLWARVGHAIVRGLGGESWTTAAQQSGFADSAHLSRTCRRMFGIAPTMLGRVE